MTSSVRGKSRANYTLFVCYVLFGVIMGLGTVSVLMYSLYTVAVFTGGFSIMGLVNAYFEYNKGVRS